ncbi:MAG: HD domain-containing protein [Candidatus Omnitrophica bacterium]|nr:HD domain-containing protein [Candidatus Omnitrophota bacterium]
MAQATRTKDLEEIRRDPLIKKSLNFVSLYQYDHRHSQQVSRLAVNLFDELHNLHNLSVRKRMLIEAGALLHDIGWKLGKKFHHKSSLELIMQDHTLPISDRQRVIIGLIARYHRKSLPKKSHKYFSTLAPYTQKIVCKLASFVRLADGLDYAHKSKVKEIRCNILPNLVIMQVKGSGFTREDKEKAEKKTDLFQKTYRRRVKIIWTALSTKPSKENLLRRDII